MKQIKVEKVYDYTEDISEGDRILFLKPSLGRLQAIGGVDLILKIDKSNLNYDYSYYPTHQKNKVFNGKLKQLSEEFNLFKIVNCSFEEATTYLEITKSNLSVLHQFWDTLSEISEIPKERMNKTFEDIMKEPLSSIMFCNFLNTYFDVIHDLYFYPENKHKHNLNIKVMREVLLLMLG